MGAVAIAPGDVARVVADRIGLPVGTAPEFRDDSIVWNIRLPRLLTAIVVGAGLSAVGTALQGRYKNRLADPHLLGIGPGAAIGGVIGALLGGLRAAVAAGTVTGIFTALFITKLAPGRPGQENRFILSGVALGAALSAWLGFIVFGSDSTKVPPVEFWLLGSLNRATWETMWVTLVLVALAVGVLLAYSRQLDLFSLGEAEARHLGVDVETSTVVLLIAVGVVTGATVGAVGIVAFIGLVIPHAARRFTGPSHKAQFTLAIPAGALAMLVADLGARTLISPVEMPVGLLTAAVGGPFLIWLILPKGLERA